MLLQVLEHCGLGLKVLAHLGLGFKVLGHFDLGLKGRLPQVEHQTLSRAMMAGLEPGGLASSWLEA